jgi:uncharacterized protein (TIGR03083 family)
MTATTTDVTTIATLSHGEAMDLQASQLARTIALLRSFDDHDWEARTDCPDWDVRAMYQHVLGACEAGASMRENLHQLRRARAHRRRFGGPLEAALSAVQVRERADLDPKTIIRRFEATAPRTVRGRARTPSFLRDHATLMVDGPVHERWKLGYLIDVIYLRDMWMHRVDACRATGRDLELTQADDGRIVADVVAEWAHRHQQTFLLELTGIAGGRYAAKNATQSDAPSLLSLDAVEFCRTLAGRSPSSGLLTTVVPF